MIAGFVITFVGMLISYGLSFANMRTLGIIIAVLFTLFSIWFTHKAWSTGQLLIRIAGYGGLWACYVIFGDSFVYTVAVLIGLVVMVMFAPYDDPYINATLDSAVERTQREAKQRERELEMERQRIERRRQEAKEEAIRQTGAHPSDIYVNSDGTRVNVNGDWLNVDER